MLHKLKGEMETRKVWLNGELLDPKPSQKHYNHSPDGFSWGYGGSGAAQLALAIMLKLRNSSEGYQDFKWKLIAKLPPRDFFIVFNLPDNEEKVVKLNCLDCGHKFNRVLSPDDFAEVICPACEGVNIDIDWEA